MAVHEPVLLLELLALSACWVIKFQATLVMIQTHATSSLWRVTQGHVTRHSDSRDGVTVTRHSDSYDVLIVTLHSECCDGLDVTRHSRSRNALLRLMRRPHCVFKMKFTNWIQKHNSWTSCSAKFAATFKVCDASQWRRRMNLSDASQWRRGMSLDDALRWGFRLNLSDASQWRRRMSLSDKASSNSCHSTFILGSTEANEQFDTCTAFGRSTN